MTLRTRSAQEGHCQAGKKELRCAVLCCSPALEEACLETSECHTNLQHMGAALQE